MKRTFGWIQNPGSLETLKNVVSALVSNSDFNKSLCSEKLPLLKVNGLISDEDYNDFIELLLNPGEGIPYKKLKGKGGKRGIGDDGLPNSKCTGIFQAAIDAQKSMKLKDQSGNDIEIKKPYTDDWTADGYARWGVSTGLLEYDAKTDNVYVSDLGKRLAMAEPGSEEEHDVLSICLLSYPPVIRILDLLKSGKVMTKFELGDEFGFTGEMGFTSIPQGLYVAEYSEATTTSERSKVRSNLEGDSDKYARTIASWLSQMEWVTTVRKEVSEEFMGHEYKETLQGYKITIKGLNALKLSGGYSSNPQIPKIVYFEMLASKAPDADYLREKRARILIFLSGKRPKTYEEIQEELKQHDIDIPVETIKDDIAGLKRIGLMFDIEEDSVTLTDIIDKLIIPEIRFESLEISQMKDIIRSNLSYVNHKYLILVDLAYSDASSKSKKNTDAREFEIETASLLTEELNFEGGRLGDSGKPDVVIYFDENGTIIDNKSYSGGFNVDIKNADEMSRYIIQNKKRIQNHPTNEWWKVFPAHVTGYTYLFVTSYLKGRYEDNLKAISVNTGVNGGAVSVKHLLYLAEDLKSGRLKYSEFFDMMNNSELVSVNYGT